MKIYIHVGLHRTGSTFLQKIFFKNLAQKNSNIIFNDNKILKILKDEYIKKIIKNVFIDASYLKKKIDEEVNKISSENNEKILIISDENLIPDDLFYKNKKKLFDNLKILNEIFYKPNILIFIREHKSFIKSLYNQFVNEGFYIPFHQYIEQSEEPNIDVAKLNYKKLIEILEGSFKNRYYLFKHENFDDNLNFLVEIFNSNNEIINKSKKKLNKSLTEYQINILIFLEKNFRISKFENFLYSFFSKLILNDIDKESFKDNKKKRTMKFIIMKLFNYLVKLIMNFKFSRIIKLIKINFFYKKQTNLEEKINFNFENYVELDKFTKKK